MFEAAIPAAIVLGAMGVNRVLPNEVVRRRLTSVMYRIGVILTLGMSKHPRVGPLWNKTVEPVVVDFVDNFSYAVREGLVKGLRSDNAPAPPLPAPPSPAPVPPSPAPAPAPPAPAPAPSPPAPEPAPPAPEPAPAPPPTEDASTQTEPPPTEDASTQTEPPPPRAPWWRFRAASGTPKKFC
eukprot:jgi/Tetstr1/464033/TSEL_008838.t1